MDTLFRRGPAYAVADRRKMGQPQRRIEEGGFEGAGEVKEFYTKYYKVLNI